MDGVRQGAGVCVLHKGDSMSRSILIILALVCALGIADAAAQAKKGSSPGKSPTAKDNAITINVFLRDAGKNEILLGTHIWPGYPDYNTVALQRFFAVMKALEPPYSQDDEVAYTWGTKGKVTKCGIYLEAWEASAKSGTGSLVGCEANGVSNLPVTSSADPKHPVSSSGDSKHMSDLLDLFKKQSERAKLTLGKK